MLKKISIIILSFILFAIPFILSAPHVHAQSTGLNLTISPTILDLTANPGDTLKEKFRIRNNGNTPLILSIVVDKLDPQARNGQVVPVKAASNDASVNWISFDNSTISAQPKEWTDISFTIAVPKTAAFGYYYAFRIGPTKANSSQSNGAATQLIGQIVLPVLLNVTSSNAKAALTLVSFTPSSFLNQYLPITFQATFTNTGNIAVKPSGTIFIRLSDGSTQALDMNPESGIILPGGKRTYSVDWTDGFLVRQPIMEDGQPKLDAMNKPVYQLSMNWDRLTHFRIGKYAATLLAVYDNGTKDVPLEATTTFWVFPYTFIGISLLILIVAAFVIRFFLKWYVAKEVRKYKSS